MTQPAIKVESLSKQYRIGERQAGYRTLRESLADLAAAPFRRLFGRNGAKSIELRAESQTETQSQRQTAASRGVDDDGHSGSPLSALSLVPALHPPPFALRSLPTTHHSF